jgi:hypothetical protein
MFLQWARMKLSCRFSELLLDNQPQWRIACDTGANCTCCLLPHALGLIEALLFWMCERFASQCWFFELPVCSERHSLAALTVRSPGRNAAPQRRSNAHHILLEYAAHDTTRSFAALATRHAIKGGWRTVQRWHSRWNGTALSLQRKAGTGKTPLLSRAEISRHVRAPILAANRAHRAISYTKLLPDVKRKTGKAIALRTLQQYGKQELGARDKHTKKRTADESEHTAHGRECPCCLPVEIAG